MRHGMFVIAVNGVLVGDLERNLALLGGYMLALYSTILYAAVPMAYREHTMKKKEFMLLILLVLFLACFTPTAYYYTWWPSSLATTRKYAALIDNASCQDAGQMYISPLSEMLRANACPNIAAGVVISSAYAAIVFCAYKVGRKVKSVTYWSVSARDANKQIHAALLFQAVSPLILDVIPLIAACVAIFGGLEQFHFMLQFLSTALSFIPVVNPLSAILFVKCYRTGVRNFTQNLLCHIFVRLRRKSTETGGTSHDAVVPLSSTSPI